MNDQLDPHAPTPEFAAFLARDIARTFRHDARFAPSARARRARRVGVIAVTVVCTVAVLATGLVFGTSTGYASARVESDRRHDEIAANTMGVAGQLATLRLDLERAHAALALRAAERGTASPAQLQTAAAELRAMAVTVERIELDLAHNRTSAIATRTDSSRTLPVKRALAVSLSALVTSIDVVPEIQAIRTVTLPPATARTTEPLWSVTGVRQLSGGTLLVNDGAGREVRVFDSSLTTSRVALDSSTYGARRARGLPLIAYRGDSTLIADQRERTLRVLDSQGRIARTVRLPEIGFAYFAPAYADDKGRVLFGGNPVPSSFGDSIPIVRFDLASGRVDTVGRIKNADRPRLFVDNSTRTNPDSTFTVSVTPRGGETPSRSLVPARDDWAVLSDGSVALIRGHDYHIDWVRPDGGALSTQKLPFDWQRLTDDRKKSLEEVILAVDNLSRTVTIRADSTRRRVRADSGTVNLDLRLDAVRVASLRLNELVLAIGGTAPPTTTLADRDGNVWIMPEAPVADSGAVYDVVNRDGRLVQRVRIPSDRYVAGFGPGGVVYLAYGDRANGYFIERTKLSAPSRTP